MLETSLKNRTYNELVTVRKDCRACPPLVNPAVAADGELDSDRIGPYSRWQGNLHSDLVVVGQDFADVETFTRVGGWPGENVGTNLTLVELLAAAGFTISPPRRGISSDQVFFTNAVLCLKHGSMQAAIPPACFRACGLRFLRPTIELVSPKVVATLGTHALDAVLSAFELSRSQPLLALIRDGFTFQLTCGARLFPMCHPSRTVINTTRSLDLQKSDWKRIGEHLANRS
jgi:uracil-DNA glycosylase